jgi:FMN-dependent NADH-azoreductase
LVDETVELLRARDSAHQLKFRDIGAEPLPHVNSAFVAKRHETADPALALSDAIVAEWQWAELIILGSPMHNLSISSGLKAYLDHLMRAEVTVKVVVDENAPMGYEYAGLLTGRRALCLLSRGGRYTHPEAARNDFQKPYLARILTALGVRSDFVAAEGPAPADYARTMEQARAHLRTHPWLN